MERGGKIPHPREEKTMPCLTISLRPQALWLFVLCTMALSACASPPVQQSLLYLPPAPTGIGLSHVPTFLTEGTEQTYNRIGTPAVRHLSGEEALIAVDPTKATLYFETQDFTTARGTYRNLIYRLHFPEVPLPHLTAGANPGLLVIYTLDEKSTLLLVTTLHTCGCYLAFMPTSAMPAHFLPEEWSNQLQEVYGQWLPGLLPLPVDDTSRLLLSIESETHRIKDAAFLPFSALNQLAPTDAMGLAPMLDLYHLPYGDATLPFFESEGRRHGYVKNNTKIFERLLMSWWVFDLYIGEDKAYSQHDDSDVPLYTSLKIWARKSSDLKNFPEFLKYWGWRL